MIQKEWPIGKLSDLRMLAKDGYSAREIGERLGYSKNSVLGKAHRHKIDIGSVSKAGYLSSRRFGRKGKPKDPINSFPPKGPLPEHGLCQWPLDDVWCSCGVTEGSVYCKEHYAVAYTGIKAITLSEMRKILKKL